MNLVVRKVKKMVPPYELPGAIAFKQALSEGKGKTLSTPAARARRHRVPAVHRRHHRRVEGRDPHAPQHHRRAAAVPGLARAGDRRRAAGDHHRAAALPHLLADGELPGDDGGRRRERADHQPARHPRLRQGARQAQVHHDHRRQHAVQRAAQPPGLRQARLQQREAGGRRRHGGAEGGGRALEAGHRHAR